MQNTVLTRRMSKPPRSDWMALAGPVPARFEALMAAVRAAGKAPKGTRVEFLVEEGEWLYPLGAAGCGWGGVQVGTARGRVLVIRVDAMGRTWRLADAEIRTSLTRPWRNTAEFVDAAAVLVRQGCLARDGEPITLPRHLRAPRLGAGVRLRWALTALLPSLGATLLWKLRLAPQLQWNIGVLRGELPASEQPFPWERVKWLPAPPDATAADPFVARHDGQYWLFYEHVPFNRSRGEIRVARLDPERGVAEDSRVALSSPHHLSFPHVFRHAGHWYMLPEQAQSGATTLYRAAEFPARWDKYADLLPDFPGLDPVLLHHGDRWWLFVTRDGGPCMDNNLHLFWSERIEGPYFPHAANPIRSGLFGSRMAGPIHIRDGRLIRLAQDGRDGYGGGVAMFEIESLDAQTFVEREVGAWKPNRSGAYPKGFHAVHACDDVVVIDGQRRQGVWAGLA